MNFKVTHSSIPGLGCNEIQSTDHYSSALHGHIMLFPGLSTTAVIFQEFPILTIFEEKIQGLIRAFQAALEPCFSVIWDSFFSRHN